MSAVGTQQAIRSTSRPGPISLTATPPSASTAAAAASAHFAARDRWAPESAALLRSACSAARRATSACRAASSWAPLRTSGSASWMAAWRGGGGDGSDKAVGAQLRGGFLQQALQMQVPSRAGPPQCGSCGWGPGAGVSERPSTGVRTHLAAGYGRLQLLGARHLLGQQRVALGLRRGKARARSCLCLRLRAHTWHATTRPALQGRCRASLEPHLVGPRL